VSLIYGVMRIVNLAQWNLFALGASSRLGGRTVVRWVELGCSLSSLPAGAVGAALIGAILEPDAAPALLPAAGEYQLLVTFGHPDASRT